MGFLSDFLFGKKDGPFESYYKSGQLKEKGTYKDGEWDGLWEEYYRNGQLSEKGVYKDGEPHGPFEGYSTVSWNGRAPITWVRSAVSGLRTVRRPPSTPVLLT